MPKARQTCTRCSMRRQKCDKKQPCTRCLDAGEAKSCSRVWAGGYDPRVHRQYPKAQLASQDRRSSTAATGDEPKSEHQQRRSSSGYDSDEPSSEEDAKPDSTLSSRSLDTMTTDSNATVFPESMYATRETNARFRKLALADDIPEHDYQFIQYRQQSVRAVQAFLPSHTLILQLVDYHIDNLLWRHDCVHGPTFRNEVLNALQNGKGSIQLMDSDFRWSALLFAMLTVALTCAPDEQAHRWGFSPSHKISIGKKWYESATVCLVLGEYSSRPHPYSVQTIAVLALASHLLGLSNRQFVQFGTALKIAQSLGLQRLPYGPEGSMISISSDVQLSREIGRRIWWNLVIQDWFSIASYDMFSINPQHFTTPRPQPYPLVMEESAGKRTLVDPLADWTNRVIDTATIMVEAHIATSACDDISSKYEQVLKHDAAIRQSCSRGFHHYDSQLPWLTWAKAKLKTGHAHNIIQLHREFLGRSFRDPAYAYTRWASIDASKSIVLEMVGAWEDPHRPTIYQDQAFLTAAGVTLCLDIMHRADAEPQFAEHRKLVEKAMELLNRCQNSVLATRGHRLVSTMLKDAMAADPRPSVPEPSQLFDHAQWPAELPSMSQLPTPSRTLESLSDLPSDSSTDYRKMLQLAPMTTFDPQKPYFGTTAAANMLDPSLGNAEDLLADAAWPEMLSGFSPTQFGFGSVLGFEDAFQG